MVNTKSEPIGLRPTKTCITCSVTLTPGENWYRSFVDKKHYKCKSCYDKRRVENRSKQEAPRLPSDVPSVVRDVRTRHQAELNKLQNTTTGVKEGFVYILRNPAWEGWVKIGSAVDPFDRARSYQTGSPHRDYVLVGYAYSDDRKSLERTLHKAGHEFRGQGEWFKLDPQSAISFISTYAEVHTNDQNPFG